VDGDGFDSTGVAGGTDCDDDVAAVYPGAPDIIGDGIDADCDGNDGNIFTVAGGGNTIGDGGPATAAGVNAPLGASLDGDGNLFIADTYNHRIRQVNAAGIISTVAGNGTQGFTGDGGKATDAEFNLPSSVWADGEGDLFIADSHNQRIRKVDTSGIITTIAGNGEFGHDGDGGPGTSASLEYPVGITGDTKGNLFWSDNYSCIVRKLDTSGKISIVAGNISNSYSGDGGPATSASINFPNGLAIDAEGGTDHGLTKCPVPQFELLGGKVIGANALRQNVSLSANGHFV
jgi:hypothetical protein